MKNKVALIGGGGARTPLFIYGLAEAQPALETGELALFDIHRENAETMAALGRQIVAGQRAGFPVTVARTVEEAIEGARFVVSSIRVGGMEARARDERMVIDSGYAGQETTGAGGLAMALRTIPVALEHARLVELLAPDAWLINFTNPAGLITRALRTHTRARAIGICDTPAELFHRIAWATGAPFEELEFRYLGLNHLGFVRAVLHRGEDITKRLLADDHALMRLYPAPLFDPKMIRAMGLIPTEYLFFYFASSIALANQRAAGASRGEELARMNAGLFAHLRERPAGAMEIYKDYLNARNASYMRLEGNAESALGRGSIDWDPFQGATGYHRIALEVMTAVAGAPREMVVNVVNDGAIQDLRDDDIVEVPSVVDPDGARPLPAGALPAIVKGLVLAVNEYERLTVRAAVEGSFDLACLALFANPIVGEWEPAVRMLGQLVDSDARSLGYLRGIEVAF